MNSPLTRLAQAGILDPDWYRRAYPDVVELGMDPAEHFLRYGQAMGRAPSAEFLSDPHRARALGLPVPRKGRELLEAHEIARGGEHALGMSYARLHVPSNLAYTIEAMRANEALALGDQRGWLRHLNIYMKHFDAAPVQLADGDQLVDRFTTAPLPAVTGGPLVSIIMPAWNAQKTIRAAAQSVLAQTWRNLELLIVDDFSTDGTWGVMQELAASDKRVRIFRNRINVGPYVSKNIALTMANGEWITGHDADDWAHPQRVEHHMKDIHDSARPPRASATYMIRLEEDGLMDRFAPISGYSLDGIARLASISTTFQADFLRERLGGWDNIRFGADSELIARTKTLIGNELVNFSRIGMLCMNLSESLTNHANHGVGRREGLSPVRQEYLENYVAWHKQLKENAGKGAKFGFPPASEGSRPFPAPEAAKVPLFAVRRNYAALTGKGRISDDAVTVICASKRPAYLGRVAKMLNAQTHVNLHVVYVAHGPGHDIEAARQSFPSLQSVIVLQLPDQNSTLGAALNMALDHCQTDLVAKMDDDDYYGPEYITGLLAAFRYSGHRDVGIVGKARAYCYVEELDTLALRFGPERVNQIRNRVFGGTIFWSRSALQNQRFIEANTGEDSAFFKAAEAKGVKIFSADSADYVHVRYAAPDAHTWNVSAQDFLESATVEATGLRLDLVYSSAEGPRSAE